MKPIQFLALGADPEVFLVDRNGHPKSSEGLIGGTKEKPLPMEGLPEGFYVQEDNVAAEYNIPPAKSAEEFSNNIVRGLGYIRKVSAKHKLKPACVAAYHFKPEQLATPHAQRLGCEPDLNMWDLEFNPPPVPPATLRTAAGHVHVSWHKPEGDQKVAVARSMDAFLGLPSILVTKKNERRSLYGKAGAVRDKTYGIEYRTLDNFWLTRNEWRNEVFNFTQEAIGRVNKEGEFWLEELEAFELPIREAINSHDVALAAELCSTLRVHQFTKVKHVAD